MTDDHLLERAFRIYLALSPTKSRCLPLDRRTFCQTSPARLSVIQLTLDRTQAPNSRSGNCSRACLEAAHRSLCTLIINCSLIDSLITASELRGEYAQAITLNHMDAVSLHTDLVHSSANVKSPFPNVIILLKDQYHNVYIAHTLLYIPQNINYGVPDPCGEAAIIRV